MQDKHDTAIDKTLASLGSASPPDGMEARINQRMRYAAERVDVPASPGWASRKSWWLGVVTGAAVATFVLCAAWVSLRGRSDRAMPNNALVAPAHASAVTVSRSAEVQTLCPGQAVRRQPVHARAPVLMRSAVQPQEPVLHSAGELTPQERELVRLTRVADPKDLSTMTLEARATAEAQQSASFQRFFTPPPPPPHDEGVNE